MVFYGDLFGLGWEWVGYSIGEGIRIVSTVWVCSSSGEKFSFQGFASNSDSRVLLIHLCIAFSIIIVS